MYQKSVPNKLVWLIPIGVLMLSFFHLPIWYYTISRIIITISAGYLAYLEYQKNKSTSRFVIIFCIIAFMFNPILKIHFYRSQWAYIDIVSLIVYARHYFCYRKKQFNSLIRTALTKEDLQSFINMLLVLGKGRYGVGLVICAATLFRLQLEDVFSIDNRDKRLFAAITGMEVNKSEKPLEPPWKFTHVVSKNSFNECYDDLKRAELEIYLVNLRNEFILCNRHIEATAALVWGLTLMCQSHPELKGMGIKMWKILSWGVQFYNLDEIFLAKKHAGGLIVKANLIKMFGEYEDLDKEIRYIPKGLEQQ